ncbi:MAG: lipoprotein-releasing system ATP-binding protein LolD, partial [Ferrovum sp.]|nr:lipoprotein-releasing system ATP-binding protein LolD [Ferrovum sp.]
MSEAFILRCQGLAKSFEQGDRSVSVLSAVD